MTGVHHSVLPGCMCQCSSQTSPVSIYTELPKREWVGLTEDEVYRIAVTLEGEHWKKIADAIEAKLKEKNT